MVTEASMIQSNFGEGNLEVVARMRPIGVAPLGSGRGDHLSFFYYESRARKWRGPFDIKVDGRPIAGVSGF